jgi:protein transport protein DSL1/ZW10
VSERVLLYYFHHTTMAFPVPDHLPRRAAPQDISSKVLSRLDDATSKTLNAELAASWVQELDATIDATKVLIEMYITP